MVIREARTVTGWRRHFEVEAERRHRLGDPAWERGSRLHPSVVRSIQRFQVGEAGDGANLIEKARQAGDGDYLAAVRLFVAEEQNHARMLRLLLHAARSPTIAFHWSDTVFARLRRALGLRVELLVLLVAEVIALHYYRALRDGTDDSLTTDVADRILSDERRHVPFHCDRLRPAGALAVLLWRVILMATALVVALDHGRALHALGVTRRRFIGDVLTESATVTAAIR